LPHLGAAAATYLCMVYSVFKLQVRKNSFSHLYIEKKRHGVTGNHEKNLDGGNIMPSLQKERALIS
jgi:hypothetical protein